MAKIVVLQHHPAENLGTIADALEDAALAWQYVRVFDGHPIPQTLKGAGGLIVMGGSESVYQLDRYPYLRQEIALIESALKEDRPVLGVCLGSQLLAAALGATVRRGQSREIGWYPVMLGEAANDDCLMKELPELLWPVIGTTTSSTCRRARWRWPHPKKRRYRPIVTAPKPTGYCSMLK